MILKNRYIQGIIVLFILLISVNGMSSAQKIAKVVDADGVTIQVNLPVKRVVCLSSAMNEILYTLGVSDRVVGIDANSDLFPLLRTLPVVASSAAKPQIEAILQLKPDLILADTMLTDDARKKFTAFGIPVIVERTSDPGRLFQSVRNLAVVMERPERGEELIGFISKYEKLIQERLKDLKREKRVRVFWEWREPYKTGTAESSVDPRIINTGGINICSDVKGSYPIVSGEYVWQRDPQVIIKMATRGDSLEAMKASRNELMNRQGLKDTSAVKNKRVYIISWEIHNGIRSVIGGLYYAKWLHPDRFQDLQPGVIHQQLLERFYQQEGSLPMVYP